MFLSNPAHAAEPVPGNSCAGFPEGAVMRSGGPELSGRFYTMTCRSGVWNETGINPAPASCQQILAAGNSTGNGLYTIDPDGDGGADPFQAVCDMTANGGGWTQIISGAATSLADLQKFGDTSAIAATFTSDPTYGLSWGSTNYTPASYHISKISFSSYKITYSGFYDWPAGGMGWLMVGNQAGGLGTLSLEFTDAWDWAPSGQTLAVNNATVFAQSPTNVSNRTDIIPAYSPYFSMYGYGGYPYARRYIKELWVR